MTAKRAFFTPPNNYNYNSFPTSSGSRLSCSCGGCSSSGSGGGSGSGGSSYIYNLCDIVHSCDVPHIDFGLDVDFSFMSITAFKAQF